MAGCCRRCIRSRRRLNLTRSSMAPAGIAAAAGAPAHERNPATSAYDLSCRLLLLLLLVLEQGLCFNIGALQTEGWQA